MTLIFKIFKYQTKDNLRSRWIFGFLIFFLAVTYWLTSFSSDPSKVILSLLNLVLIVIPFISIIFGTIYIYNNISYIKFMLSQPISRKSLFAGLFFGLTIPLIIAFLSGIGIPILFNLKKVSDSWFEIFLVSFSGILLILIFTSLAFLIATKTEDRLKGLGISIILVLFFSIVYDGLFLFLLQVFQDYPTEKIALGLTLINPIDIARIITVMKLDISALMGYTGAVFESFFGNDVGTSISIMILFIWFIFPFFIGMKQFAEKDF